MTKTLLELARQAVRLRTVMDDCLNGEYRDASKEYHDASVRYHDASNKFFETYRQFEKEATPQRIIELCEALEGLLNCPAISDGDLNSASWGCPESAAAVDRARRALKGE